MSDFTLKGLGGAASIGNRPIREAVGDSSTGRDNIQNISEAKSRFEQELKGAQAAKEQSYPAKEKIGLDAVEDPLDKAAKILEEFIPKATSDTRLQIDRDEVSGRFIYKSVDKNSGETVRQFPPEYMLKFLELHREAAGLVMDDEV